MAASVVQPSALSGFEPDPGIGLSTRVQKALFVARRLQERAAALQAPEERRQQAELDRMIRNPADKATLTLMTDQAFRAQHAARAVEQLIHILDVQGIPRFFSPIERTLLRGFQSFGGHLPGVAVPLIKANMRKETANVILPAETGILTKHLRARTGTGLRMNVNFLGEALLGEVEARHRLERYLAALEQPDIECISVKISTIYSQISALAREHSIGVLADRLERLYRAAAANSYRYADGTVGPKFVYLDMEEYRDMSLTAAAFMQALDRDGLSGVAAGIALQAYVPDSFQAQQELTAWARQRVAAGGAPITVRLVKGANMEMERIDASLHGWPQAPYKTKRETDANYKRMIDDALAIENASAVRVGIASHNLFELAYGLVAAEEHDALDRVQFEMLEGMANSQRRALAELNDNLLLYAPASRRQDFIHAIGYLIRRLDENTGPDNFLAHAFKLEVGGEDWNRLERQFVDSLEAIDTVSSAPRRTQDRNVRPPRPADDGKAWHEFVNEPDTDFSLPQNGRWAERLVAAWRERCGDAAADIPLVVGGEELREDLDVRECLDPSRPGVVVGRYRQAGPAQIEQALATAVADEDGWRSRSHDERYGILGDVAQQLRLGRADLMGAALADGGKTLAESDPEVSEAVDFVEFYRRSAGACHELDHVAATPRGVVVVVSPWNFPIAIPCGGIAAALAAGNTVILKPASDTVLVAYELCRAFWRGGVPRRALQFVPCAGAEGGARLVSDTRADAVILTGGTDTAQAMLRQAPGMQLLAETGGKDATIVTAMSDRELAIKHVIHSAFSHAGQKCSATSLLILEAEVYEDESFRQMLCDAVSSLRVGSAWDLDTWMGPLIRPPAGALERALTKLDEGESWAVAPRRDEDNPNLVTPGLRWGVQPGSVTHMTELFGPVLAVMKAKNLEHAIELTNQTGYGLTAGLESLDEREQALFRQRLRAGNLYINRGTTGAIVLRQPFGGMGKSAFGPGIKAGGPNYVTQLMRFEEQPRLPKGDVRPDDPHLAQFCGQLAELRQDRSSHWPAADIDRVLAAIERYDHSWRQEFSRAHDHFRLVGQDNFRQYLPVPALRVRIHPDDSFFEIAARICAARQTGCRIAVSTPAGVATPIVDLLQTLTADWAGAIEFVEESNSELVAAIGQGAVDRIRYAHRDRVPPGVLATVADSGICLAAEPVLAEGRIELLWYLREQSVCVDYHRYGNLGVRAAEQRSPVL